MGHEIWVILNVLVSFKLDDVIVTKSRTCLYKADDSASIDDAVNKALEALKMRDKAEYDEMKRLGAVDDYRYIGQRVERIEILDNPTYL